MKSDKLAVLYEHIDDEDIREYVELLMFNAMMLEYSVSIDHRISFFGVTISTKNREHLLEIEFQLNVQKKYLVKISFSHYYNNSKGWYNKHDSYNSGNIAPNFMLPLEKAMEVLIKS